ncbi:hypothetical protein HGRIS_014809 [Hohenbuehelia grisea]|uniref:Uncharacterized protein n=1 Tax=Hohenbuehelia grisea TaxID=104357 RepID=A0ABR3IQS6_9AGAR
MCWRHVLAISQAVVQYQNLRSIPEVTLSFPILRTHVREETFASELCLSCALLPHYLIVSKAYRGESPPRGARMPHTKTWTADGYYGTPGYDQDEDNDGYYCVNDGRDLPATEPENEDDTVGGNNEFFNDMSAAPVRGRLTYPKNTNVGIEKPYLGYLRDFVLKEGLGQTQALSRYRRRARSRAPIGRYGDGTMDDSYEDQLEEEYLDMETYGYDGNEPRFFSNKEGDDLFGDAPNGYGPSDGTQESDAAFEILLNLIQQIVRTPPSPKPSKIHLPDFTYPFWHRLRKSQRP